MCRGSMRLGSKQAAAAATELNTLAADLRTSIAQFKTGEAGTETATAGSISHPLGLQVALQRPILYGQIRERGALAERADSRCKLRGGRSADEDAAWATSAVVHSDRRARSTTVDVSCCSPGATPRDDHLALGARGCGAGDGGRTAWCPGFGGEPVAASSA